MSALDSRLTACGVSRETRERLAAYEALLNKWAPRINLVGSSTLREFWSRHVLDSAQLAPLAGAEARVWLDAGSGAGFPGLVIAAMLADIPGAHVHLVEPSAKRCAFLREAARAMAAPATIHQAKIEAVAPFACDIVTARAFASLGDLLDVFAPFIDLGARALVLKGEGARAEIAEASTRWAFAPKLHSSLSDPRSFVVDIDEVTRV
jgi:16S rRNA (guanine527-N7)-methyltransferase